MRRRHPVRRHPRRLIAACSSLLALVLPALAVAAAPGAAAARAPLPAGFSEAVALRGLNQPTAVEVAADGRVFVAEKRGVVLVYDGLADPEPEVFADLRTEVHNHLSRGLVGLELHPSFPVDPGVYVLYAHDAPIGGQAPYHGVPGADVDPCGDPYQGGCEASGRLSRLMAYGNRATGEQVLVEEWCQQHANHTMGALAFGADGALYASGSDGATYDRVDLGQEINPCGDPPGAGGALRSQSLRGDPDAVSLAGTVVRVDPNTGRALGDNPLAGHVNPNAQRIVAYGLRNPFRIAVRPGTSELWIGDVGMDTWEEVNRTVGGDAAVDNFGWPCYEGDQPQVSYAAADLAVCRSLYGIPGAVEPPHYTYPHDQPSPEHAGCRVGGGTSVTAVAFYPGGAFPAAYDGALFLADHARRCIWHLPAGAGGRPDAAAATLFHAAAAAPVDLEFTAVGDLLYADLDGGTIRRVSYTG